MSASPIERFIDAIDALDVSAAVALMGPQCQLQAATGHTAEGAGPVSEMLVELFGEVRSSSHRLVTQWHIDEAWIAELEADYELTNDARITRLPRAVFWRAQPNGSAVVHVYGAHEGEIRELGRTAGGLRLGGNWIPPL